MNYRYTRIVCKVTMTIADDDLTPADGAEEARIKAEVRRQRILEKSRDRMKTVSGEQSKAPEDGDGMSAAQSSGASRIAAMRRRRFQRKVDDAKAEQDAVASLPLETNEIVGTETAEDLTTTAEESTSTAEATSCPEPEVLAATEPASTENPKIETVPQDASEKRKYKGVAAVRRQKILEKQQRESEATAATSAVAPIVPIRKKVPVNVFPIMMHFLTIFILLAAGFDVGYQQVVHPSVTVHPRLAPHQHGIGLLRAFRGTSSTSKDPKEVLLNSQVEWSSSGVEDEFGTTIDDEVYKPNIDPLFGLDLDLMTRGDGILFMLARGAVACHRALMMIFYNLPIKIFVAALLIPKKLLATPPVLALVALVVRQTAKRVFGAGLPIPEKESAKEDFLGMLKNGFMSLLSSSFPTVVGFYDAFTHLTADMFIILCGVFVGLAWTHNLEGMEKSYGTDEL